MVFVLTVDQIDSRHHPDRIPELDGAPWADRARLPFARTAGDEAQAVFDEARDALRCAVELALTGRWHCGIGQGPARLPAGQPDSRAGRGPAFLRARTAVEQAKADPSHLGFQGGDAGFPFFQALRLGAQQHFAQQEQIEAHRLLHERSLRLVEHVERDAIVQ